MGSKVPLWGQRPSYGGSKAILWGVKGHPMGSIGSKAVLWDPMGSKTVLWGQSPIYGVRAHPMGSEPILWGQSPSYGVRGHPMGGQRSPPTRSKVTLWALWGPISPYGIYRIKAQSMGSNVTQWGQRSPTGSEVTHGVKGHPMGGQRPSYGVLYHPMGSIGSNAVL